MNLLCWMSLRFAARHSRIAEAGRPASATVLRFSARGKLAWTTPLLVGGGVVLGVEDQLDVDAAVERGLQAFGGRQIAKFVETSEQRVARPCRVDEPEQGVVEIAAQPLQRFELPGFGLEVVRPLVAEAALIGLAAGDPAIEEDVVGERRIERLGAHADRDRRGASIEVFRPAPDRMEDVVVAAVGLGGEIVPDEALHRVVEGRDGGSRAWGAAARWRRSSCRR